MSAFTTDWVGQTLDRRYRVVALLGEGGMGYVLRARDLRLGCDVVLKVPRPEMLADAEFRSRFRDEVVALVRLAHPHIVKVTDYCQHDGTPFAVMQFLSGGSLDDRRPRDDAKQPKPVSPRTLGEWLRPIADALDFIHKEAYIHRDVKPANILFDAHKHPFLGDFGVAKALASGQRDRQGLTGVGMVIGTPEYMAPELVMGESADGRIDQYALAITVFEILSGRVPFTGPTGPAVLVKQTSETAPRLCEVRPTVSEALSDAVARGMAKKPADRFANCIAFAEAVLAGVDQPGARVAKAIPNAAPGTPSAETPRATSTAPIAAVMKAAPARSRKGLLAIVGGAFILLAASALSIWIMNRPASPKSSQPDAPLQVVIDDPRTPGPIPKIEKPSPGPPEINFKSETRRPNQNKGGSKGKNRPSNVAPAPLAIAAPTTVELVRMTPSRLSLVAGGAEQELEIHVDRRGTGPITIELQSNVGVTITPSSRTLAAETSEAGFRVAATGQLQAAAGEVTVSTRSADSLRTDRIPITVTRLDFRVTIANPKSLQMRPGDARDVQLSIDRSSGYRGPIQIAVESSSTVEPSSVAVLGRDEVSATVRVRAKRGANAGESPLTIQATATELSIVKLVTIPLQIARPPILVATIGKSSTPITSVAMHGSSEGVLKILNGGVDGSVHNWYRPDPKRHPNEFKWGWSHPAHKKAVSALAFSPDGRQAVSGSLDGTVALWDTHTKNEVIRSFNGKGDWHKSGVFLVYFQPRGALPQQFGFQAVLDNPAPVSISDDAGILWDESSGGSHGEPKSFVVGGRQRLAKFGPPGGQSSLRSWESRGSLSADGHRRLTLETDGRLRLWDTRSNSLHAGFPWKPDSDDVAAAALSVDGTRILIGHTNGAIQLWRVP